MKAVLKTLLLAFSLPALGQDGTFNRVIARQSFYLRDYAIDSVQRDTNLLGRAKSLPTSEVVRQFVEARASATKQYVDSIAAANSKNLIKIDQTFPVPVDWESPLDSIRVTYLVIDSLREDNIQAMQTMAYTSEGDVIDSVRQVSDPWRQTTFHYSISGNKKNTLTLTSNGLVNEARRGSGYGQIQSGPDQTLFVNNLGVGKAMMVIHTDGTPAGTYVKLQTNTTGIFDAGNDVTFYNDSTLAAKPFVFSSGLRSYGEAHTATYNSGGYSVATDADFTIGTQTSQLATITANRTLTILPPQAGTILTILNKNNSAFSWSANVPLYEPDGTTVTTLDNLTIYEILYDGSNYHIVSKCKKT